MSFAIAVDAGGTTTRCVVLASGGVCLGLGRAGRGNPVAVGAGAAARSLGAAVKTALAQAGVPGPEIEAVVITMAGGGLGDEDIFLDRLRAEGVRPRPVLKGDLLSSLCSGTPALDGYALIAGTGAGAARIAGGEMVEVADSLGWLVGDAGSGFWIGHQVVRAAFDGLDGRGPPTALTPALLGALDLPCQGHSPANWRQVRARALSLIYDMRPVELSQFAQLAFQTDDLVAEGIVDAAAAALALTLQAVADPGLPGPLVLAGGVFAHQPDFAATVQSLAVEVPATDLIIVTDGAVGAAVLALRQLGETVDQAVFDTVVSTLSEVGR